MKKTLLFTLVLLALLTACAAPAPTSAPATAAPVTEAPAQPAATEAPTAALTEINVCYTAPTTTQAVPWYALEHGIFEKYGLKVNLVQVGGSSKGMAALISGDADLCEMAGSSVVNAVAAGKDAVMLAAIYNTFPAVLVVRPEIKTVDDLRGKTIATDAAGTASEVAMRLVLQKLGLKAGTDVNVIEVGPEPDRLAAYNAGQVDGMLSSPPYLHIARSEGVNELFDFGKSGLPFVHTSIVTTRKFVSENRPAALAFLKAIVDATAQMKADPDGVKAVLAQYLKLDVTANAADLADSYENVILPLIQDVPYPNMDGVQTLITVAAETNPDAAGLKPDQLVDISLLKELEDSGFIATIVKK